MKICIPTDNNLGEAATIATTFGAASYFTLLDTDSAEIEVIENREREHGPGGCRSLRQLRGTQIDAVVCNQIGRNAVTMLSKQGIATYGAPGPTVAAVAVAARTGRLQRGWGPDACCGRKEEGPHDPAAQQKRRGRRNRRGQGHDGPNGHGGRRNRRGQGHDGPNGHAGRHHGRRRGPGCCD
jgi:predicted Fe-Mo cluster-binding NifX family protein